MCMCYIYYYYAVFCFFFFKQKTAYDMLISDWSSDVCSSDLVVAGVVDRVLEIAQRIVGGAERDSERLATDRHRHVTGTERGRGAGVSGRCELFRFGEKIGRASCRERVCQYV